VKRIKKDDTLLLSKTFHACGKERREKNGEKRARHKMGTGR
jgi:hypothetical protein